MQSFLFILTAILLFGVLIAVHELGHFLSAKSLGVKVNEFAIGMGPKIWHRQGKETVYSLRLLPIGGFCAMEGEDEDSHDPRAFGAVAKWRQFIILIAGSAANFLTGLVILLLLFASADEIRLPAVGAVLPDTPAVGVLEAGDKILAVDGRRVLTYDDLSMFFARSADGLVTLELERGGARLTRTVQLEQEGDSWRLGFAYMVVPATIGLKLQQSVLSCANFVRMVWFGLSDIFSGRAGLGDLSGPIAIVAEVGKVGGLDAPTGTKLQIVFRFMALIAVNLAVMNLLPIPALDGGRILFLFVGGIFTVITKRKLNPKFEGYINAAGLICLLALMAVVAVSDVIKQF